MITGIRNATRKPLVSTVNFIQYSKYVRYSRQPLRPPPVRPSRRYAANKAEAQQAAGLVFRTRDLLVRQRTQIINAIRGHLTEFGWVAPAGPAQVSVLASLLEEGEEIGPSCPGQHARCPS
jgi:transposase